jgi:hypothetical protein
VSNETFRGVLGDQPNLRRAAIAILVGSIFQMPHAQGLTIQRRSSACRQWRWSVRPPCRAVACPEQIAANVQMLGKEAIEDPAPTCRT